MLHSLQNRDYLLHRHRLSHQQIDTWLNENRSKEFVQEKMSRLQDVKRFLEVTDLLRDNHIPFTCLKGPMLSFRIYGDPAVRFSHDVDLLVKMEELEKTLTLLTENGYQYTEGMTWPKKKVQQELLINNIHHASLIHKQHGFCVEVHWVIMSNLPLSNDQIKEVIEANLTTLNFTGRSFTVMNKELELLFLMIHGARHGWSRLKWLMDINDYPYQDFKPELFKQLASRFKANRLVGQTDYLVYQYFKKHLPFPIEEKPPGSLLHFAQKSIEKEINEDLSTRGIAQLFCYQWFLFPSLSYKLKTIRGMFFRLGDIQKYDFSSKTAYFLYRPYSFIKRRILHV